jgi:hypothetical protein
MATDLQFPIVLRMGPGSKLFGLVIGAGIFIVGVLMSDDDGTTDVPIFGDVSASIVGVAMAVIGLGLTFALVNAVFTGKPTVTLDRDGVVFTPNLARERRVAWSDVAEITTYRERYGSGVSIRTHAGVVRKIPAIGGTADDLCDLMLRCIGPAMASTAKGVG